MSHPRGSGAQWLAWLDTPPEWIEANRQQLLVCRANRLARHPAAYRAAAVVGQTGGGDERLAGAIASLLLAVDHPAH